MAKVAGATEINISHVNLLNRLMAVSPWPVYQQTEPKRLDIQSAASESPSDGADNEPASVQSRSAQLTVLTAAPVVATERGLLFVVGFLASNTQAHARDGLPAGFGDRCSTVGAMGQARTAGKQTL